MVTAAPRGQFITLEGTEGVGKSSLMTALSEWLTTQGESVITTREPGGTLFMRNPIRNCKYKRDECHRQDAKKCAAIYTSAYGWHKYNK